eukprot:gnl/MRDRNA2_/MRDRNA2_35914_c0_seq1.p1 gnl/MRDRNA2_/MRDRNA2_35914_c0~~gnl/MRDRNA2_/MRDRNA2_35914_c0_seq1.p1  ORF type:complete len:720 (-),score=122.80 gnl/MRDRNA2_/MRDRNA2_35914_c0_seq1:297-2456(-)
MQEDLVAYKVVAPEGALVRAEHALDSEKVCDLPWGTLIFVAEIVGRRARIEKPEEGWVSIQKKGSKGEEIITKCRKEVRGEGAALKEDTSDTLDLTDLQEYLKRADPFNHASIIENMLKPFCEIPYDFSVKKFTSEGLQRIRQVAKVLKICQCRILCDGHAPLRKIEVSKREELSADDKEEQEYHLRVNAERASRLSADATRKELIKEGVKSHRIETKGSGNERGLKSGVVRLIVLNPSAADMKRHENMQRLAFVWVESSSNLSRLVISQWKMLVGISPIEAVNLPAPEAKSTGQPIRLKSGHLWDGKRFVGKAQPKIKQDKKSTRLAATADGTQVNDSQGIAIGANALHGVGRDVVSDSSRAQPNSPKSRGASQVNYTLKVEVDTFDEAGIQGPSTQQASQSQQGDHEGDSKSPPRSPKSPERGVQHTNRLQEGLVTGYPGGSPAQRSASRSHETRAKQRSHSPQGKSQAGPADVSQGQLISPQVQGWTARQTNQQQKDAVRTGDSDDSQVENQGINLELSGIKLKATLPGTQAVPLQRQKPPPPPPPSQASTVGDETDVKSQKVTDLLGHSSSLQGPHNHQSGGAKPIETTTKTLPASSRPKPASSLSSSHGSLSSAGDPGGCVSNLKRWYESILLIPQILHADISAGTSASPCCSQSYCTIESPYDASEEMWRFRHAEPDFSCAEPVRVQHVDKWDSQPTETAKNQMASASEIGSL